MLSKSLESGRICPVARGATNSKALSALQNLKYCLDFNVHAVLPTEIQKRMMIMRKLALVTIVVFVCCASAGSAVAGADPGARDSIWFDDVEWNGDSSFATTLYTETDDALKHATIVLTWSTSEMQVDSVSLIGSRWASQVDGDSGVLVATQGLISGVPSAVHYDISFLPFGPLLTAGSGAACTIHWSKTGGMVSGGVIAVDSSTTTSGGSVQNSTLFGTSALPDDNFVPAFAPASVTVNPCSCPLQNDFDDDSFLTALDLGGLIDILFAGVPEPTVPTCPAGRADFDCDGFPTALDLGELIDHLFAGQPGPCDPCACVSYPDDCP